MKKKQNKDYWNYDYIDLSVKVNNVEEVVLAYNKLGWQETNRFADKQYKDVLHLSFKREHKIQKKAIGIQHNCGFFTKNFYLLE